MAKPKPRKPLHLVICNICGDPFETREDDRDHCYDCHRRPSYHVPPQQSEDIDTDGWYQNGLRHMEDSG